MPKRVRSASPGERQTRRRLDARLSSSVLSRRRQHRRATVEGRPGEGSCAQPTAKAALKKWHTDGDIMARKSGVNVARVPLGSNMLVGNEQPEIRSSQYAVEPEAARYSPSHPEGLAPSFDVSPHSINLPFIIVEPPTPPVQPAPNSASPARTDHRSPRNSLSVPGQRKHARNPQGVTRSEAYEVYWKPFVAVGPGGYPIADPAEVYGYQPTPARDLECPYSNPYDEEEIPGLKFTY